MRLHVHSYRYALEILEHSTNREVLDEIMTAVRGMPLFIYPGKSGNPRLDVVQQCLNTYFDRVLGVEGEWLYHPLATRIRQSKLAADFRKMFPNITVQAEVQFGNMSRWYSDVFKFQTAYSQSLIHLGLCIVPVGSLARRIDSNVAYYERVLRELPSAELSITLPILVIGVEPDENTPIIDLRRVPIPLPSITRKGRKVKGFTQTSSELNRYRLVHAYLSGADPHRVTETSDPGRMPTPIIAVPDEDEEDAG